MTLFEESYHGQQGPFPVDYQEIQAWGGGVTTGEAVTNFEVQKLRQGKVSDQWKRTLAFLLLHDMSIGTMPFRTERKINAMIM